MRLRFTKMQGAGNDFVVLDATQTQFQLSREQLQHLGDRHFGVGADQILVVEASPSEDIDFGYRIFNNSGDEVEHCGNDARCFVRFVRERGLTSKRTVRVQTVNRVLELQWQDDGQVTVDMGAPRFAPADLPFVPSGLAPRPQANGQWWPLEVGGERVEVATLSMGNPHAVLLVADVDTAPVLSLGPAIETHACFPAKVNVGFMQVLTPQHIRLRVFERNAGETLACGTGACAAVVAGVQLGLLQGAVNVDMRGGLLQIEWPGGAAAVRMTGPTQTVFEGEIEL